MDERRAYYRVACDGFIVDTFLTGADSSAEREQARALAVACAERTAARGGHVKVTFLLPYTDTWLTCAVWDSLKQEVAAQAQPYHRLRLSPLAAPPIGRPTHSDEGLTARLH